MALVKLQEVLLSSCSLEDPSSSGKWLQKFSSWDIYGAIEEAFQPASICQVSHGGQEENQCELGCTWHWPSHYFSLSSEININIAIELKNWSFFLELLHLMTIISHDFLYDFLPCTMSSLPPLNLSFCASVSLLLLFVLFCLSKLRVCYIMFGLSDLICSVHQ